MNPLSAAKPVDFNSPLKFLITFGVCFGEGIRLVGVENEMVTIMNKIVG